MGEMINVKCSECQSSWDLKTGYGLLHGRKDAVIKEFSDVLEVDLIKLFANKEDIFFSFKQAECCECCNYVSVPTVSEGIAGQIYFTGMCPVCGNNEIKITENTDYALCPRCGKGKLKTSEIGHWD